jgi:hypothetical protein
VDVTPAHEFMGDMLLHAVSVFGYLTVLVIGGRSTGSANI